MDQTKLICLSYVLRFAKGTTVRFLDSDPILHSVLWPRVSVLWPRDKDRSYRTCCRP